MSEFSLPAERAMDSANEAVLRRHAKSFHAASLFLAPEVRRDVAVLYAFCRWVDDLVDEASDVREAYDQLDILERALLGGPCDEPLVAQFLEVANRYGFGVQPAIDLVLGMRSDLGLVRVRSATELELYCYRAAGTVGLMMMRLLGVTDPRAVHYAVSLGMAMQLTNICRDVLEDAERDRLYLPLSELKQRGATGDDLPRSIREGTMRERDVKATIGTVGALLERADVLYRFASNGFAFIPFRSRVAVVVAAVLYRAIGQKLSRTRKNNPLLGRVSIGVFGKFWLGCRAVLSTVWARFWPIRAGCVVSRLRPILEPCPRLESDFFRQGPRA